MNADCKHLDRAKLQKYSWMMSDKRAHKNAKTHGHNGDGETSEDEDDKDEQGRRQM